MTYEITTPDGVIKEIEAPANDQYLKDLETRGYTVKRKYNVCESCEG